MRGMFGAQISMVESLVVTAICMGVVFFVLIIISQILSLFKYIPGKDEKKSVKSGNNGNVQRKANVAAVNNIQEKKFNPDDIKDENMQIAMLVASIEAAEENEGAYIKIRGIREI